MRSRQPIRIATALILLAAALLCSPPPSLHAARPTDAGGGPVLDMFTVTVDAAGLAALRRAGYDIATTRQVGDSVEVDLVLWRHQAPQLATEGLAVRPWQSPDGRTAYQLAVDQAQGGYKVWKPFDGPGGLREEVETIAKDYPAFVKLVQTGQSVQGRPILALKVTKDALTVPDGTRPAVFYQSLQHAREWIGGEVTRRLLWHFLKGYGKDPLATELVDTRELWFVLAQNPDGYQLTFEPNMRLWRKTVRDNNGDGKFTWATDGVDPNRNFESHWGYDNEGSEASPSGWTYRGPAPASEPETQATQLLLKRVPFEFMVNYHSVAGLLLYGPGWQVDTAVGDDPISEALSGTDAKPAIPDTDPQTSGDLYIVNGDTCDFAIYVTKTLCWTPELTDGGSGKGFVFPDDEALVEQEFQDNLPFALDLAKSAADPARPVSHLGNVVQPMYPDAFTVSYGDPQPVQVNAARYLGAVTLKWSVNGGPEQAATTVDWKGGERYGPQGDIHFHRLRGQVSGARPGDSVAVWFEAGALKSSPFTYTLAADTGRPVLVVAAEEEGANGGGGGTSAGSGRHIGHDADPAYLAAYLDALRANGMNADVYDVNGHEGVAPHPLGILGHYAAVVWYGGDKPATWLAGEGPQQITRQPQQLQLAMRDYLNEGGRLLYAGQWSAFPYFQAWSFNPYGDVRCDPSMRCKPLTDDFMQYYLGVGAYAERARPERATPNRAGSGGGLWTGVDNNMDLRLGRRFDLTAATGKVVFRLDGSWNTETDADYGFVEVSTDGGLSWIALKDEDGKLIDRTPKAETREWALNGTGSGPLRFDLSAYAGGAIDVRLRYTSDYWNYMDFAGWTIDNLVLEDGTKVLYTNDLSDGASDWTNSGIHNAGWRKVPYTSPAVPADDVVGGDGFFEGLRWSFGLPDGSVPRHSGALQRTNQGLGFRVFPLWDSHNVARYDGPGYKPHKGEHALYSGSSLEGYQRLTRTLDLTSAPTATLDFWTSYETVSEYHSVFVEAHTVGEDDWTTLPEANGHTSPLEGLGPICVWGLTQLAHYSSIITETTELRCRPSGTTGEWHAATGASDGWEHWQVDLSRYAGKKVEVAISYLNLYYQAPGVWLDDVALSTGEFTSFEGDLGGWTEIDPPPGHPKALGHFEPATADDYPLGAAVATEDTVVLGFGLEGVASASARRAILDRAMRYLLRDRSWRAPLYLPLAER